MASSRDGVSHLKLYAVPWADPCLAAIVECHLAKPAKKWMDAIYLTGVINGIGKCWRNLIMFYRAWMKLAVNICSIK